VDAVDHAVGRVQPDYPVPEAQGDEALRLGLAYTPDDSTPVPGPALGHRRILAESTGSNRHLWWYRGQPGLTGKNVRLVMNGVLLGASAQIEGFKKEGIDFVVERDLPDLVRRMNRITGELLID
jgi:hypothetical protein